LGQFLGFIVAIAFLAAAYSLGMNGHEWLGGIIGGTTLTGLVTVFVIGKKKQNQDLLVKA
ncbi:MAG TPA: DUF2335 domain-containing protein, partial [Bacteroidota bacterium]|nr:DUF2335 domain-containing protein [Bacteroidota bacterium]